MEDKEEKIITKEMLNLKEKGEELAQNNRKVVFIGKKGDKEVVLRETKAMNVLDTLFEQGHIVDEYFSNLRTRALMHMTFPTMYENSMWKETRPNRPLTEIEMLNEESVFAFQCWIEDKYKPRDVADILEKFTDFDHLYLTYFASEDEEDEEKETKYSKAGRKKMERKEVLI